MTNIWIHHGIRVPNGNSYSWKRARRSSMLRPLKNWLGQVQALGHYRPELCIKCETSTSVQSLKDVNINPANLSPNFLTILASIASVAVINLLDLCDKLCGSGLQLYGCIWSLTQIRFYKTQQMLLLSLNLLQRIVIRWPSSIHKFTRNKFNISFMNERYCIVSYFALQSVQHILVGCICKLRSSE